MSCIYKLSISGIRSFSDETQETIQFSKPLTLIVGTNGSGKTTIIECLRYATTNELPPNTKNGASFINDPNLHSSNETKAQIKLAFQNTRKVNMILSKSLMAIKNPRTQQISFKTKENQLMAIHHGEKQTISSKVADIENLIPHHLGVSKAILNYVTFCHQDESLWPISESAVLKKKFDEIFDSSKFIKILDSIKLITKEINTDVKLINNNVEHLKNDRTRAQNKRQSIKVLQTHINNNKTEMQLLQEHVDEVTLKLQQLYTSNQDYERTISKMESLEQDRRNMQKNIEGIKLTTEIIHKPKEVLLSELNNFTNVLAQQTNECLSLQNTIESKQNSLSATRDSLNKLLMKSGNLEALHNKHLANIQKRKKLIEDLEEKIRNLTSKKQEREQKYTALLSEISAQYDKAKFSFTKETQHLEYMKKDSQNLRNKIQELESRYESIAGNQSKLDTYRASLSLKEESFTKIKALNEISTISQQIDIEGKKLTLLEKDYQKEFATKLGETTQLERQMKEAYSEINRDYRDVDKKYTSEYAKLQTKLAMATDLTTLYKATDNGVMEFHQTQMQKINNIIDELWKKTYTGNDVETIKIKADPIAVKKKSETSATNNRSYNYRVVMIKNGTELDMRGRCSAGQRVLASIIIRIALAECFCLNFGMIALDEPTTNLDDENIESLAKALHAIIEERSVQRNFQLIIITHDEKFLRCMNAVDFTDHYYKVIRDERLNSTINKVSIATVTE
ncbi:hypothetical protein PICMEDRAFT_25111, partial [Pichia membranifaciens NRRL Y-2026]